MRLKTHIRAGALLRRAQGLGLFGAVLRKGDPDGGVLFVLVRSGALVRLFVEDGASDGQAFVARTDGFAPPAEAEEILRREAEFDRDLWVVEIEGEGAEALLTEG